MRYIPHTPAERQRMLARLGIADAAELFADLPARVRLDRPLDLPAPMAELELQRHLHRLSTANADLDTYVSFLGAGAYDHYVPAIIDQVLMLPEFYTAYTPYQPEVSQGTLQAIFEYQSLICLLTGMDVANASLYDGATALAEAGLMACQATGRPKLLLSEGLHPEYRQVVKTYAGARSLTVVEAPLLEGQTTPEVLSQLLDGETAGVAVQHPNFFGVVESQPAALAAATHAHGGLFIACVDPISLGLFKPPGEYGADIVVGEGQGLGNNLSFGGPYLGLMATTKKLLRRLPGRVAGQTVDDRGRRGFVLTLLAREQHIRRGKAASNICSNAALSALAATVYLATLGKQGLRRVAELCLQKAHYAYERLLAVPGIEPAFDAPFFKEFTVKVNAKPSMINRELRQHSIIGGLDLGRVDPRYRGHQLFCVTEKRTREEIDRLAAAMEAILCQNR